MNKSKLKSYAPAARRAFIQAVTDRAHFWGLSEKGCLPVEEKGDMAIVCGRPYPRKVGVQVKGLAEHIKREGFSQVMEEVAYTWFNRFMALRYMELHDYLEHGFRVLSNRSGSPLPEVLEQAVHVRLPGLNPDHVAEMRLDGTKDGELYRMLLVAQCNALHEAMPFLFERIDDETELLLPDNLLHSDSLIRKLVIEIDEEDWQEVEIIGWLYECYISERHGEVIGKVVKSEDIPAATQVFTPNWIVKYMVQNTLGRKWLATYSNSPLRRKLEYYIEPAGQTPEVQAQLKVITPDSLDPELLTFLDPAMGSGHILAEAYDVFKEIYLERGYSSKDFPRLILEKNLYGLDIDDRAAQMAGFALLMKARKDDRRILRSDNPPRMNVMAIRHVEDWKQGSGARIQEKEDSKQGGITADDIDQLIDLFKHGKILGSLLAVPSTLSEKLTRMTCLLDVNLKTEDFFDRDLVQSLRPLVKQAELLARKYDVVVANPPYMGSNFFCDELKRYVYSQYASAKSDLYGCFIIRDLSFIKRNGYVAMITIPNWMFLTAFADLRKLILDEATVKSLVHIGRGAFGSDFGTCCFVLQKIHLPYYSGTYRRLFDKQGSVSSSDELIRRFFEYPSYFATANHFSAIPGRPFAYWAAEKLRLAFRDGQPLGQAAEPKQGIKTGNNDRFMRLWYEVPSDMMGIGVTSRDSAKYSGYKWFPCTKGGPFRKWYGNHDYVLNWLEDGLAIRNYRDANGRLLSRPQNIHHFFKQGITWSKISISEASMRLFPSGFAFESIGSVCFPHNKDDLFPLLAFLNSSVVRRLLTIIAPTVDFGEGALRRLPVLRNERGRAGEIARQAVEMARLDWDSFETSWDFRSFPWLASPLKAVTVEKSWQNWQSHCADQIIRMQKLETENNRLFIEAYGLQDELTPEVPEDQITLVRAEREADMKRLISYAIGCMMGRYSLDEPELIYANSGNISFDPSRYKTFPPDEDGIIPIMDIDWFPDDVTSRFEGFLKATWSEETLEENLKFVAESLSPKNSEQRRATIRRYMSSQFFKDHLQTYKKRPIYWLFSSGKQKAFECLVYLHRYNERTLSRMRNEYVTPLHGKLAARADYLKAEIDAASTTSGRNKLQKELEVIKKKQVELAAFDELLRHYADKRISLDLDDGVKLNYGKFGALLAEVKAVTGE